MNNTAFKTYASENGGRVVILFLLFLLALYEFCTAGFSAFAIICMLPVLGLFVIAAFHYSIFTFWMLFAINYLIQWKDFPATGIPMSLPNEMLEILLIGLAIIDVQNAKFHRLGNAMFLGLVIWAVYCTLEVINDTCSLGIQFGSWYTGARMMAYQLLYAFIVFTLYISEPKVFIRYLYVWACFALFAAFWVWKQNYIGLTTAENAFIMGRGFSTHIINGGSTRRLFSIYSDAANFGVGTAATAVAFVIFGITSKIKKQKYFFLITGLACLWAMFPSGTRTATFCAIAGFGMFVILSKSFKIAIPAGIILATFYCILAFTTIGNGNAQIRRMRSGFNKDDASMSVRSSNQKVMKKYLAEAPFGIGLGMGMDNVPANNKFRKLAVIPPDSEYVFIWIRTGPIGLYIFLFTTFIIFVGACWIVMFRLRNSSLRGFGAGFCCAFVAIQLGGYANQVLMQFPNCLVFYGGLSIVYSLPWFENEWIAYEEAQIAKQEEKKRLKLEKKRQERV